MTPPRRPSDARSPKPGLEMLLFLAISAAGVYALGSGLRAGFQPGRGLDLGWLAVAGAAMRILFLQMGRVHDSWPRRPGNRRDRVMSDHAKTRVGAPSLTSSADDPQGSL